MEGNQGNSGGSGQCKIQKDPAVLNAWGCLRLGIQRGRAQALHCGAKLSFGSVTY